MTAGRPTKFTPELAEEICNLLADGMSLRKIQKLDGMPNRHTIMRWEREDEEFRTQIARARDAKQENDAEELEEINQQVRDGVLDPQQAAIISNNVKWVAGKLLPGRYGDKTSLEVSNKQGESFKVSDTELDKRIEELTIKLGAAGAAKASGRKEQAGDEEESS